MGIGHLGTLVYHSFRFRGICLFNAMPKHIRDLSCSVSSFKYQLDKYLGTIPDTPCIANSGVGLPGGPRPAKRLSGQPEPYYGWPGWPAIIFH